MISLGFTENEADLYLSLLNIGKGTIGECIKESEVSRTQAYVIMRQLLEKGVVAELAGKPAEFIPMPPKTAFNNFLKNRMDKLKEAQENLPKAAEEFIDQAERIQEKVETTTPKDKDVMVLRGVNTIRGILDNVTVHDCIRTIARKPMIMKGKTEEGIKEHERERKEFAEQGIIEHLLVDTEALKDPDYKETVHGFLKDGHEVRHLPSVPLKLQIYDDFAVLLVLRYNRDPEETLSIFAQNKDLTKILTYAFDAYWDSAKPLSLDEL